jgi:Derlin-2/3
MDPQTWFQSLPLITQSWFGASVIVNVAATLDILSPDDLFFDWHRIYDNLELWRLATSFLYAGGSMHEFHVLILLYLIPIHSTSYEKNPYPTGGTPRADYGFCISCCIALIVGSFLLIDNYEDSILSLFSSFTGSSSSKRFRRQHSNSHYSYLLYPLFTRTLVTSIMYLWSRRNPNVNIQLNFVPIRGQYLPFAHVGLALLLGNRINELLHGILVGHVYYYLVEVVPAVTGGRRILTTPSIFVHLLSGPQQDGEDYRVVPPPLPNSNNINNVMMRAIRQDGASRSHIAAKLGNLEELRRLSASPEGRASLGAKDRNDWQPLHEAVRGGYLDVVRFLLDFDDIVDVNARTRQGPNPLWLAETAHGREHPVTMHLREVGAVSFGPQEEEAPEGEE